MMYWVVTYLSLSLSLAKNSKRIELREFNHDFATQLLIDSFIAEKLFIRDRNRKLTVSRYFN